MNNLTERLSNIGHAVLSFGQGSERFRDVLEALPVAIYTTDAAGALTFYNEGAAAMWGRRPEMGELWCGSWKLYRPDGTVLPHDECPMAIALKTGRKIRGVEAVAERPDGTRVPFVPYPTPLRDDVRHADRRHQYAGRHERPQGSRSHRRSGWPRSSTSSDDAIVSKDLNGIITSLEQPARRDIFGYAAEEISRQADHHRSSRPSCRTKRASIISNASGRASASTTTRPCAGARTAAGRTSRSPFPRCARDGEIIGASKIARDITDRNRPRSSSSSLSRLNHRVKNTLATVQAIASQTMRRAPPDDLAAFTARLHALGRAHDLLTSDKWDRATLRSVVMNALEPFQQQRFTFEGPEAWLNASKSLQLTLALHELATNAVKYGALSGRSGRVNVSWQIQADGRVTLSWRETGGPRVAAPEHRGFGSLLIEHTFEGSRIDYEPDGVSCVIEIPA